MYVAALISNFPTIYMILNTTQVVKQMRLTFITTQQEFCLSPYAGLFAN